jgi:hypothetical protein
MTDFGHYFSKKSVAVAKAVAVAVTVAWWFAVVVALAEAVAMAVAVTVVVAMTVVVVVANEEGGENVVIATWKTARPQFHHNKILLLARAIYPSCSMKLFAT